MINKKTAYFLVLFSSLFWCGSIILAPYLKSIHNGYDTIIYFCFSGICHQLPDRSFYIFGEKFAVCERCSSIYFAFLSGVILYPVIKKINYKYLRYILYFAIFIIVIEFLFGYINVFQNTYTIIFSGALFGLSSAYFVTYGLIDSIESFNSQGGNKIGR